METDPQDFLQALPHGAAFRFVDQLRELVPGIRAVAEYTVRGDEAFLEGHFPGNPILPGVILIEAMAQLGGIVLQSAPDHPTAPNLFLTAVDRARINGAVPPGKTVRLEAEFVARMDRLGIVQATAHVDGELIAQARVTLSE